MTLYMLNVHMVAHITVTVSAILVTISTCQYYLYLFQVYRLLQFNLYAATAAIKVIPNIARICTVTGVDPLPE